MGLLTPISRPQHILPTLLCLETYVTNYQLPVLSISFNQSINTYERIHYHFIINKSL